MATTSVTQDRVCPLSFRKKLSFLDRPPEGAAIKGGIDSAEAEDLGFGTIPPPSASARLLTSAL
jgi:hypothetical protein